VTAAAPWLYAEIAAKAASGIHSRRR
jgi:hypothetical protein